jgi:hypothetical protein
LKKKSASTEQLSRLGMDRVWAAGDTAQAERRISLQ